MQTRNKPRRRWRPTVGIALSLLLVAISFVYFFGIIDVYGHEAIGVLFFAAGVFLGVKHLVAARRMENKRKGS